MQLCSGHFADLRAALQHKGLWYLVDLDPRRLVLNTKLWLNGDTTDKHFDPFVASLCEIRQKATELIGTEDAWQHACPLCAVAKHLHTIEAPGSWIDNCTDMMVLVARVNNISTKAVLTS